MSDREQSSMEKPAPEAAPVREAVQEAAPTPPAPAGAPGPAAAPAAAPGGPPAAGAPAAGAPAAGPPGSGERPERRPWRPRERGDDEGREGGGRFGGRDRFKDGGRPRFGRFFRRKVCKFCSKKLSLHYRDADTLRRFITERGKILPRRITGTCPKHQRRLAVAIKQARSLALLPFVEK